MDGEPNVKCRCCGESMTAEWQAAIVKGREGFYFLTCDREGCALFAQTFTTKSYDTLDLTPYLCKQATV